MKKVVPVGRRRSQRHPDGIRHRRPRHRHAGPQRGSLRRHARGDRRHARHDARAIKQEAQKAGLTNISLPTCSVADQKVDTGAEAKCFASYMRIHALEATGGKTYAQMGRYLTAAGKDTNDADAGRDRERPAEGERRSATSG